MGMVNISVKEGDKVICINDNCYIRHYGTGKNWEVPRGIKLGEIYLVLGISEDYFGSNKLILEVNGERVIVSPLYMDGQNYGQRFEKVNSPNETISEVI